MINQLLIDLKPVSKFNIDKVSKLIKEKTIEELKMTKMKTLKAEILMRQLIRIF